MTSPFQQLLTEFEDIDRADIEHILDVVLRAMLQAPEFVYRVELGTPTDQQGIFRLSDYEIAARLVDFGAEEVGFGDTTGMANPVQVGEFFTGARAVLGDDVELTAHFHNTRGQGLANVLAALQAGVSSFESSFGELGGCPVPVGATGNIATEDLVSMLHEMRIETGIDLEALLDASAEARRIHSGDAPERAIHGEARAEEARTGVVIERHGVRFGFLAYTFDQRNGNHRDMDPRVAMLNPANRAGWLPCFKNCRRGFGLC